VPYKAVDSLIDALARTLRRLDPGECAALLPPDAAAGSPLPGARLAHADGPIPDVADPRELRAALRRLRDLLGRLARRQPGRCRGRPAVGRRR
jgi:hypothetical protein